MFFILCNIDLIRYFYYIAGDITNDEEHSIKLGQDTSPTTNILTNPTPPSEFSKFFTLLYRTFLHLYRDWVNRNDIYCYLKTKLFYFQTISHLRLALHLLVGLLLGVMFFNYGQDASKTFNNVGFFIISVVYLNYTSLMPAVLKCKDFMHELFEIF